MNFDVLRIAVVLLAATAISEMALAEESSFRFLATGDLPYTEIQDPKYRELLRQSEAEDFTFLMHVGDFKAQKQDCSDVNFTKIRDLFRAYPKPIVYTPGDNEWTDCVGVNVDPIERLQKIRELFFEEQSTLRLEELGAEFQIAPPEYARYIENYRFSKSGVLFVVAHVVGSNNNRKEKNAAAIDEYTQRVAANQVFLRESFALAVKTKAKGVAVVIHANPDFETQKKNGFEDFRATMTDFLASYDNPVVCIHGDSHYFRIDKPLRSKDKQTFLNFTRLEVFGSPNVVGVDVTVDPSDPLVFRFRPYYLNAN